MIWILALTSGGAAETRRELLKHPQSESAIGNAMNVLGVAIEDADVETVRKVFGDAKEHQNGGDAAASLRFVCYEGGDGTTLLFSWGEIGAGYQLLARKDLADLSVEDFKSPVRNFSCSPTSRVSRSIIIGPGLHLGMKHVELQKTLGKSFEKKGALLTYWTRTKVRLPTKGVDAGNNTETWTRDDSLKVQLHKNSVVAIRGYRITTQ